MKWIPQRALNVVIWDMCYCPWCWVGLKTSFLVMKILFEKTQCFQHWFFVSRIFSFFFQFFQKHSDFSIKISILRVKNVWFFFSREQFGHNLGWFCAIWASQFGQNKSQHRLRPKHRVPGRRLRVGITSIIQHAGLLDAIERNRTEQNTTILSRAKHNRAVLYYTILYCTVLYIILCYVKKKR